MITVDIRRNNGGFVDNFCNGSTVLLYTHCKNVPLFMFS
jgi:hypothetical protein